MERTESLTAAYGSRTQYEREKERLIIEINQGMDTVNRNLQQLNQNLESAISLGTSFGRIASLWNDFGMIIDPPIEDSEEIDAENKNDSRQAMSNAEHADIADAADNDDDGGLDQQSKARSQTNNADMDTLMDEDL
ncbi:hypothetical protein J3B02_002238 [Coemansia erecta]|uniref:DASH complex subunit DAD1 n=1 Tax=Coemansia asiatica TaxID=1052880 RepID=A0A9W7XJZ9_9FUNG|nr:hypothetical protein LPJ64_002245 [Coemansia asiatica]KAJ2855306.1 hypothetical protein J3B02_002238 [Coemansia erecta]